MQEEAEISGEEAVEVGEEAGQSTLDPISPIIPTTSPGFTLVCRNKDED